jgi:hypothetical protein
MNIHENSKLRLSNLKHIPAHNHPSIYELEREFGKYCFVPLDIPVIHDDKIIEWFNDNRKAITKVKPDVADKNYGYSLFNSVNVCLDRNYYVNNPIWTDNQYLTFKEDFPHFYQQLMDLLPLAKIPRLSFWNSTNKIAPHRDHSYLLDMPNSFRVMIQDENPGSTLYLFEEADGFKGHKHYVPRLESTNTFAWNNLRVEHGSDYDSRYSKILLIINDFIPDYRKYKEIMNRSVNRYAEHLLISQRSLNDFVLPQ